MFNLVVAQISDNPLLNSLVIYFIARTLYSLFIICVYIVRAVFDIPRIVRLHKAQVRLLEEIAKNQGVDGTKVKSIITERNGWDNA